MKDRILTDDAVVEIVTRLGVCDDVASHLSPMSTEIVCPEGSQTECHNTSHKN